MTTARHLPENQLENGFPVSSFRVPVLGSGPLKRTGVRTRAPIYDTLDSIWGDGSWSKVPGGVMPGYEITKDVLGYLKTVELCCDFDARIFR